MKKILLGLIAALFATVAFAADMPLKAKRYAAVDGDNPINWTGAYIGGSIGYGWDNDSATVSGQSVSGFSNYQLKKLSKQFSGIGSGADVRADGGLIQGAVGYNYQLMQNWVLGVEFDYGLARLHGATVVGGAQLTRDITSMGSLTGRVGYLVNQQTLVYAKGGWAFARSEAAVTGVGSCGSGVVCPSGGTSDTKNGWTVGGGFESKIGPKWSWRAEAMYAKFGDDNFPVGGSITTSGWKPVTGYYGGNVNLKNEVTAVKVGVFWHPWD